jgi:hypothetical protein
MNVEERLTRLERENRRLKIAGMLILLAAASVLMMGQVRPPSEVVAQRFTLVNGDGVRIAELMSNDDGLPYLGLYVPGQRFAVVSMGVSMMSAVGDQPRRIAGPYVSLSSATSGQSGVSLTDVDDMPGVTLYDRNANGRVLLSINDAPRISIWNEQLTRAIWQVP